MAAETPNVPQEVTKISIEPAAEGSEIVETPEGETPEGEEPAAEGEQEPGPKKDQLVRQQVPPAAPAAGAPADPDGIVRLPGETEQVFALRNELTKTRALLRGQRGAELLGEPNAAAAPVARTAPAAPNQNAILSKYKPAEVEALKEVIGALGYVKADQLQSQTYAEKGQVQLDGFLDKHPEYLPENDPDGRLWAAFKDEFGMYKQPTDPKDFTRIFNRVHAAVFGIQAQGAGGKTAAAQQKVKVASSGSAAAPSNSNSSPRQSRVAPGAVRRDMLKGFSEDELAEMGV